MALERILTGDRPTAQLHLGHWVGSLANRVRLQHQYECFLLLADVHVLTTRPSKQYIEAIGDTVRQITLDYLACGIDPDRVTIYLQSAVAETYELNVLLEMLVTVPRLQRLPSLKEMKEAANLKEMPFGLLGYPVLQTADILLPRAHLVPVGKDNEAHIELAREIARRFNNLYGEVFPLPRAMIGEVPTLVGTDGNAKMSKSLNNAIFLSDDDRTVERRVQGMFTDPNRIHADVPGRVEGNPVFMYHDLFNSNQDEVAELKQRYRAGRVGDGEVKEKLARALNSYLGPFRERREKYSAQTGFVDELIYNGTLRTREVAHATLSAARKAMGLSGNWNRISRAAERRRKRQTPSSGTSSTTSSTASSTTLSTASST